MDEVKREVCPQCGGPLVRIRQPDNSPLNHYQWLSSVAGDYYCPTCPTNNRGNSPWCYWWRHELPKAAEAAGKEKTNG